MDKLETIYIDVFTKKRYIKINGQYKTYRHIDEFKIGKGKSVNECIADMMFSSHPLLKYFQQKGNK